MFEKFYDTVTVDNINDVAEMIQELLDGKEYMFISCNKGMSDGNMVDVHKNQYLNSEYNIWFGDDREYAGVNFSDTYGVWGFSTSQVDRGYDHTFHAPYVVIHEDRVKITHRAPAGHILEWLIVVTTE